MNHMRNPGSMRAALSLIQSCLHNNEYEDAERYARHAYFMIAEMTDNFIPTDEQPFFLAHVSYWLARAILGSTVAGGIPPEGKQKAGEEAIVLARKALELRTQLYETDNDNVAGSMASLAEMLDYFINGDDDEVLRLLEQAIAIYRRVEGSMGYNVALSEGKLGNAYLRRANRADDAGEKDRAVANMELALPHFREGARIQRANNLIDKADEVLRSIAQIEENIRQIR